jgi:transcriptional regulator with XRE-family HTH domain
MDSAKNKKLLLGQRLKLWRKDQSLRANKLAKDIGISAGSLSEINTGERENLDQTQFGIDPKILHDEKLKGLVEKLVNIYTNASPVQRANILGYLSGVDHQN